MGAAGGTIAGYADGKPNNPAEHARYDQLESAIGARNEVVDASQSAFDVITEHRGPADPAALVLRHEIEQDQQQVAALQAEANQLDTTTHHSTDGVLVGATIGIATMVIVAGAWHGVNWFGKRSSWLQKIR